MECRKYVTTSLSADNFFPCEIHCKILLLQHTELIGNVIPEMLGVVEAESMGSLELKSRSQRLCSVQVRLVTAKICCAGEDTVSRKGCEALLCGRTPSPQEGTLWSFFSCLSASSLGKYGQRCLQCAHILSRMRAEFRELLPWPGTKEICVLVFFNGLVLFFW